MPFSKHQKQILTNLIILSKFIINGNRITYVTNSKILTVKIHLHCTVNHNFKLKIKEPKVLFAEYFEIGMTLWFFNFLLRLF